MWSLQCSPRTPIWISGGHFEAGKDGKRWQGRDEMEERGEIIPLYQFLSATV